MMQRMPVKPCQFSRACRTPFGRPTAATAKSIASAGRRLVGGSGAGCAVAIGANRAALASRCRNRAGIININRNPGRITRRQNQSYAHHRSAAAKARAKAKDANKSSSKDVETTASVAEAEEAAVAAEAIEAPPSARQLTMHALRSAVPMIGFGFMDNTIMIHAGHYVDCTLGVTFGLSTLAAAGIGQIFSGIGGVMFGDVLDAAFKRVSGSTKMTKAQRAMRAARVAGLTGGVAGVTLGCVLGLVNLLFVDEHRATMLKLQALEEGQEFEFEVEVDNEVHQGYTTVTVRGPDVDGVLASITASIASMGCSVVELHAENRDSAKTQAEEPGAMASLLDQITLQSHQPRLEDVFLIKDRSTHQAIENEDLDDLARTVLAAAKDPLNSHSLKAQVDDLQMENIALADRVSMLEELLEDRQITIVPSVEEGGDDVKRLKESEP